MSLSSTSPSPSPHPGGRARRGRAGRLTILVVAAGLAAALLPACGDATNAPSSSPPAEPTPVPTPRITSGAPPAGAVDVVREFWKLAGEGRLGEAKRFLVAADSPIRQWTGGDIAGARFVRVVPHSVARAPKATVEFSAIVWIRPSAGVTPWGETGTHQLFENVMRMSDGTWRMYESGTGP